jgi:hypothetical protein
MATVGTYNPTLLDVARRTDPDGKIAAIAELLHDMNPILEDMPFKEGNLPTGHKHTIRTGLPDVYWRMLNEGVPASKSTTKAITDGCGMLEAYSEVDKDVAKLNGNTKEYRMSEDMAFLEAMNQEMASTLFYGNTDVDPEKFIGLAPRYSATSTDEDNSGYNVIDGGGGDDGENTSIWLVGWGINSVFGIYPKGSKAGLNMDDLAEQLDKDSNNKMKRVLVSHFKWDIGLCVRDWRYVVRIANIDVADLAGASAAGLVDLMIDAIERLPASATSGGMVRPVFYCNRTIMTYLRKQIKDTSNVNLTIDSVAGKQVVSFDGVPVRRCDAILNTENDV